MNPVTFPPHPPKPNFWMMQVPVISTLHFCQRDLDALYDREAALMSDNDGRSVIAYLSDVEEWADTGGVSEDGMRVLRHFAELGYEYLRFDPDGNLVAGLPTFEAASLPEATTPPIGL